MKKILLTYLFVLAAFVSYAQTGKVTGRIVDAETGEGLFGTSAAIKGTSKGANTDFDGVFTIANVKAGTQTLVVSYIGYEKLEKTITVKSGETTDLGAIKLEGGSVNLQSVTVVADVAIDRKTPVAVSTLKPDYIQEKLGTQEFPEVLKSTPGVYATKQGGGYGDGRINLRGFNSANVAVMINGVPINDMEWGGVYWSNWAGLSDVTRSIQVQRGLGASKLAVPSVGGSINIMTKTTDMKKGGSAYTAVGNDGYRKTSLTLSTGLMDNGWAVTASGSNTQGDGYIHGTEFEGWSYFFNVAKQINDNHEISLTGFGAPQWHNQRGTFDMQTIKRWEEIGDYRYNATVGYDSDGQYFNSSRNFYHKPQFSLNHFWTINEKSYLSTALYASYGNGGGYSARGSENGKLYGSSDYTTITGAKDYATIQRENAESLTGSTAVIGSSNNNHKWYGLLTTYNTEFMDDFTFSGGVDARYYVGEHNRTVLDLFGGDFMYDNSRANSPILDENEKLGVGDVITRDYDGLVLWTGTFGQVEYNKNDLSVFAAGSFSNTQYQRRDNFYYTEENKMSETVNFMGWSAKGGANYNLTDIHNVFANVGYFSRAPFFSSVFVNTNTSNAINEDALNEKVFSAEVGYGLRTTWGAANLNAYYTQWNNKTLAGAIQNQADSVVGYYNAVGVNALHQGIELDFELRPVKGLNIRGMVSVGDWKWTNNVEALATNADNQPIDKDGNVLSNEELDRQYTIAVNTKGVHRTDAAQTTAALGMNYQVFESLKIGVNSNFYDRLFAQQRNVEDFNGEDTWKAPAYTLIDANLVYKFKIAGFDATATANVHNLLDTKYISDAQAGSSNTWETARVFYGFGRTWSTGLKVKF